MTSNEFKGTFSVKNKLGSAEFDVTNCVHIDDYIPVIRAMLVYLGFHSHTIDDILDSQHKEFKDG